MNSLTKVRNFESDPQCEEHDATEQAYTIVKVAHESAQSLYSAITTNESEDAIPSVMRSLIVFAGAGVDATAKALLRDSLPTLIDIDNDLCEELTKFVERAVKKDAKNIASALVSKNPREYFISKYIDDLTGGSLQSTSELIKTTKALGIKACDCGIDKKKLDRIFRMRNSIVHELDIDFDKTPFELRTVDPNEMLDATNTLLNIADCMVIEVDIKICSYHNE